MNPGTIVRCRNRDWVLVPSEDPAVHLLRPLTGATDEVVAVHKHLSDLIGYDLPLERVQPATFPLPSADDVSDATGAHLLWQAARLTLREGATPFRSLGRISIRPRVYQFVPLLMGLRLDPVRMLIADDVGVGKTIEALLIARELYDRGEIRRICVLCPPYLCDQWQRELTQKFGLDAVVVRSGTVSQLERRKTGTDSIYRYYPVQVASIDFVKSDRNRHLFLLDCPDFVIVDEAHGSASAAGANPNQHERHQLVSALAAKAERHLILLTATPHSGFTESFKSLLGLINEKFGAWDVNALTESGRAELVRHFVQRARRDIESHWEGESCFPAREPSDETYRLSAAYRDLFQRTYQFCSDIVRSGESLDRRRRRVRYWGALALLRCVMSSPAAALTALGKRKATLPVEETEPDFRSMVFESAENRGDDELPTPPIDSTEQTLEETDRRRLRALERLAAPLQFTADDTKLARCAELVDGLLQQGFHPIVWCRYIATADYVAEGLERALRTKYPDLRVASVTGRLGDDEREVKVAELAVAVRRVLVATDCLSEGVNLQQAFTAVVHYDLPWNPNRLEQREGRVDRFGQRAKVVRTIRFFSPDSAVDGVVLDVLLNKAREIRRTLGTHVPVPEESESVTEAVLNALFLRGAGPAATGQLALELGVPEVAALHKRWDLDAERERVSRTRFAQRALKPDEVRRELEATDAVLGDPSAVREFVLSAGQRLGLSVQRDSRADVYRVEIAASATSALPSAVRFALPPTGVDAWLISFVSPTPEGAEYLGRNHRFVSALASYLLEDALSRSGGAAATRCGVIRTRLVERLTTLYLLRVRYLLQIPERGPLLAEEVLVTGAADGTAAGERMWLPEGEALRLLARATPDANVPLQEKRGLVAAALLAWPGVGNEVEERMLERAQDLETSHRRIRQAVSLKVRDLKLAPQAPPDLLGILVLQPAL